jgi:hypothetical protein
MKFFLIVWLLFLSTIVWAEDLVVEGSGMGVTRNEALTQARRDALARGIGQLLVGQTEVENFMVKRDFILTQTMGHVRSYDVLSESTASDGIWEVKIRALVSKEGIREDLMALMLLREVVGNPRIAVMLQTGLMGNGARAENALIEFFRSKGFDVVDPNAALRYRESPEGIRAMAGDPEAAAWLGTQLNAEVVLVGKASALEADLSGISAFQGTGMKSATADLTLRAINVSNHRIMAAGSAQAAGLHINSMQAANNALEKAVENLMVQNQGFFDAMVGAWQASANDGATITIAVQGVENFRNARELQNQLQAMGMKVQQRSFNRPNLNLDVAFVGTAIDLCEKLDGLKWNGNTLAVQSCAGSAIGLILQTP